ncbi:P-loop containing nucleoside triphosphate hydrolase protein [Diplocarpon rosae]|nr:P-loop containing nucleoside triphosphate hydrolase protein [Diplocarpon rosae]
MRNQPNLIITGTPGVGKTTHCEILAQSTGLKHLSINDIIKERGCSDGFDEEFKSLIVDEDKLLDAIEDEVKQGGYIIDWHACDLFPKSWIDLVVVLRVYSTLLYDRLKARDYPEVKLQANLDSEIMEVLLQEARDSYDEEIVVELTSNTSDEMESNIERLEVWVKRWREDHGGSMQ